MKQQSNTKYSKKYQKESFYEDDPKKLKKVDRKTGRDLKRSYQ